jgi:crotonobetainyl-CoA:carnitine CoA-transferase CaiB-like acyl-CoA transferase
MTTGAVSDSEWIGLTNAVGHPEWLDDERFKTAGGRVAYAKERLDQTADALRERTTAEWMERFGAEQVPCAPILPLSEIIRHPQVEASELLFETDHPVAGRIRQPRAAARFEETPTNLDRPAPTHGQHTEEILRELGLGRIAR